MSNLPTRAGRTVRGHARAAILGATLEIIASHGIDAVTHRRVAERAGVSPGATTHHFSSRDALIGEAFRLYLRHADEFLDQVDAEVRARVSDPVERVRTFVTEIIRREFVQPGTLLIRAEHEMLVYATTHRELAAHVRAWDARVVGHLASDLEGGGWARPVETARTLLNLVRGYELERLLDPELGPDEFERRVDSLLRTGDARGSGPSRD
jgi:AcrR family transcriptional regulator